MVSYSLVDLHSNELGLPIWYQIIQDATNQASYLRSTAQLLSFLKTLTKLKISKDLLREPV